MKYNTRSSKRSRNLHESKGEEEVSSYEAQPIPNSYSGSTSLQHIRAPSPSIINSQLRGTYANNNINQRFTVGEGAQPIPSNYTDSASLQHVGTPLLSTINASLRDENTNDNVNQPTPARKADQNIKPTKNKRTKIKTTETYGTTFDPGQQHLYTLVRNKLILAGDELKYNGKSDVHCTILVTGITKGHNLNVAVTFTADPTLASTSSSQAPAPVQVNRDNVKNPTTLEKILLEHYGTDTKSFPAKFRKTWAFFTVVRNGEEMGTLADLRKTIGQDRKAWEVKTKQKRGFTKKRFNKHPLVAGESQINP